MLEFRPDRAFDSLIPLESIRDVPYGPLTDRAQLLDILRPRATADSPRAAAAVVMHIHGGGWTQHGKHLEDCVFLGRVAQRLSTNCPEAICYQRVQHALVSTRVTRDWLTKAVNQSEICPSRSRLLHHQHQLPLRARRGVSRATRGRNLGIALGARFSG